MVSLPAADAVAVSDAASAGLGADLLSVVARLNRLATQQVRLPLPGAQARLLSTIEDLGEARICDLAAVDHCSQPTMTTQVRRLEDAGLTVRTADPHDARAVLIRITEKGVRTLSRVRQDRAAAINPQLARLAPKDRQTLTEAIRVLRGVLASATPATPTLPQSR
jgi:DNA-binding MarR family transcriptional regulator